MGRLDDLKNFRSNLRRLREGRRRLTRGERIFGWTLAMLPPILAFVAVLLLLSGGARGVGIGLLVLALVMMTIPISPILKARVRRREDRARRQ